MITINLQLSADELIQLARMATHERKSTRDMARRLLVSGLGGIYPLSEQLSNKNTSVFVSEAKNAGVKAN